MDWPRFWLILIAAAIGAVGGLYFGRFLYYKGE